MSYSKPPVVASSVALLAALSLVPSQGWARDGYTAGDGGDIIYQMAPIAPDTDNIIYQMPPLKPVKGAMAQAPKAAPKPAQQAEPLIAAKPAPAPVKESAAERPAPGAPAPQPVAEAPAPDAVAEQPAPANPGSAPVADAPTEGSPPVAAQVEGEAPVESQNANQTPIPAEQPVTAETPVIVEPAPIGPPILTINPPHKGFAAIKTPGAALSGYAASLQGDSAPGLTPKLHSLAPEPAPSVAAAQPADEPKAEAPQPQPDAEAAASAPVESAAPPAAPDARISALLAQGLAGPVEVRLGDRATMWLPAGRVFLPQETAHKLAQEAGLDWRPGVQGMVTPTGGNLEWLAPIELIDDGHIATGGAEALQPDKLLAAFQASLPELNAQRARAGQPPVTLDGWQSPPAIDEKHRLSGCTNISTSDGQSGADKFFNCEAWALGRQGAIKVGLADSVAQAARLKEEAAALADTISFDRDKTYDAFDPATDKTAPYTAADLLTRDVTAKAPVAAAPAAPVADQAAAPEASSNFIAKLFYPAVFGVAALALYALIKRRRDAEKDEAQAKAAPEPGQGEEATEASRVDSSSAATVAEPDASSLFARLLPTLHQRFAKKAVAETKEQFAQAAGRPEETASDTPERSAPAASVFERLLPTLHARFAKKAGSAEASTEVGSGEMTSTKTKPAAKTGDQSTVGGLLGKLTALRARDAETAKPAAPANDAEEPATALKKLAARMRRKTEEPAPPPVNVSRAMRPARRSSAATAVAMERFEEPLIVETQKVEAAELETALFEPELIEPNSPPPFAPAEAPETQSFAIEEEPAAIVSQESKEEPPARASTIEEDFGLIEPGDASAADAARRLGH